MVPLGRRHSPKSALSNSFPFSSLKKMSTHKFYTCLAHIFGTVLWPSHNTELTRTLTTRHGLMDVCGVMHCHVVPKQDPVVICPHHSKLLFLQTDMITKIPEDVDCCANSLDILDPMPRALNTFTDVQQKSWIPQLDCKKDCNHGTVVVVPIFSHPENPQCPPPKVSRSERYHTNVPFWCTQLRSDARHVIGPDCRVSSDVADAPCYNLQYILGCRS